MKPTVHLIKGLHLTATDKRNILATIAYLEKNFAPFVESSPQTVPNYGAIAWTRKGSAKSYAITPRPSEAGTYSVVIRESYKNDYGVMQSRPMTVTVRIKNRAALHLPNYAQPDNSPNLFTEGELSQ